MIVIMILRLLNWIIIRIPVVISSLNFLIIDDTGMNPGQAGFDGP